MVHFNVISLLVFLSSSYNLVKASQKISAKFDGCQRLGNDITIIKGNIPSSNIEKKLMTLETGRRHTICCKHDLCNPTINATVHWIIPDHVPYVSSDHTNFGAHLSSNMSCLTLKSIDLNYKGIYQCYVETSTGICRIVDLQVNIEELYSNVEHYILLIVTFSFLGIVLAYLCKQIFVLNYLKERLYIPFVPSWVMEADLNLHLRSLENMNRSLEDMKIKISPSENHLEVRCYQQT